MANDTVIKFNNLEGNKTVRVKGAYQEQKTFPTATLLYVDTTPNLPNFLNTNEAIYTSDAGELYIGMGHGNDIKKVTNKTLEKQIRDLKESTYTKKEIDSFFDDDLDVNGIIDRLNTYTSAKADEIIAAKTAELNAVADSVVDLENRINTELQTNYVTNSKLAENTAEITASINTLRDDVAGTYATKDELTNSSNEAKASLDDTAQEIKDSIANFKQEVSDTYYTIDSARTLWNRAIARWDSKADADVVYTKDEVFTKDEVRELVNKSIGDVLDIISNSFNS